MLDELDQDAAGAARMHERDPVSVRTRARDPVDQVEATVVQLLESGLDIVDTVRDVVEAGATFLEEPAHGAVGREGLEQLEPGVAGPPDEADGDTLGRDRLDRRRGAAGHGFEGGKYRVNGLDRHSDVVEGQSV